MINKSTNVSGAHRSGKVLVIYQRLFQSPYYILIIVASTIFITELIIMGLFHYFLPTLSARIESIIDALLLTIMIFPVLYFFLFRPLLLYITERVQAEDALRESEERFRSLAQTATDAIININSEGHILFFNHSAEQIFGYTSAEIINHDVTLLMPDEYKARHKAGFLRYLETGKPTVLGKTVELTGQRKDNSLFPIELSLSEVTRGGDEVVFLSIIRDITERKQATQALRESEERYRSFFEYDLTGDYIYTPDGKLIDCNQAFLDIFGYKSLEEAKSKNLKSLYLSPSEQKKIVDKIKKERVITNYEHEVRKVTGEAIFINQNTVGEFDENNKLVRMRGYIIDATERRKAEEELTRAVDLDIRKAEQLEKSYAELKQSRDSAINLMEDLTAEISERKTVEEELRTSREYAQNLIDSSLDMIIAVDKRRRITEFNRAAEETFGYRKEEILGKNVNLIYADVREGRTVHKSTVEKGRHVQEITNKRKNGKTFPALLAASTLLDNRGEIVGVMGVSRDISEQKAVEQTLRESEEKFRGVIEQSNDGIYVLQENRFVFINPRFTEITGYELEEISAMDFDFMELVAEEGQKVLEEREAMRKRGEEPPSRYVFKGLRKDGGKRDLEVSVTMVEWQGTPATLGVLHDVTKRIQTQRELEQALEKAQEGERVKSLFLANMSHEIRTPLNAILGFTDLIEMSAKDKISGEEQDFFDTIRQSGKRLVHTIHEILDMSLIEAKTILVNLEELNLADIVKKAVKPLVSEAKAKGLELNINTDGSSGYILADEDCVAKAITNVVENAIKYTKTGGIDVDLTEKTNTMALSIRDTGIGIEKEFLDEIFQVFTQESEGYTKKYQGVGLGLALTKKYLKLCDANIEVKSKKNVGSTFTLTFKKMKEWRKKKRIEKPVEKTKVELDVSKYKPLVLLVEDDKSSQRLIYFFLKDHYELDFAVSVSEAKEKLREKKVELVLLDLSLIGDEDGLVLARYMRKTKKWQGIPIIATTAHAFTEDRDKCLLAGCNDYVAKPIIKNTLLEKIQSFISLVNG